MKKSSLFPILAVLFAVFVWGISFVSTKVILEELPPVSIAFFRQLIAILPLLALMRLSKERLFVPKKDVPAFFVAGLFGIVLYFVFENTGLQYTSAANASMLVAAIPVFALITDSILSKKRMPPLTLALAAVSISGVYLVLFEGGVPDFTSKTFLGNLLVFGAMMSWIVYTFLTRRLGKNYGSLKMTTLQTICSILLFFPFMWHEISSWRFPSANVMGHLLFLGLFCSAAAYVAYLYGLKELGAVVPSAFLNLIPVVTILTGFVMLGDIPSAVQLTGAALIIGSLTVLTLVGDRTKSRETERDAASSDAITENSDAMPENTDAIPENSV